MDDLILEVQTDEIDPEQEPSQGGKAAVVLRKIVMVLCRLIAFLGATALISVAYKGIIDSGVFQLVCSKQVIHPVFCVIELLILAGYWYGVFRFSGICREYSSSAKEYYLITTIVFVLFNAAYWIVYLKNQDVFLWVFRVTVNLFGVRMLGSVPDNFLPYMLVFLAVTYLIMMTEPFISQKLYESWMKKEIEKNGYL